MELINSGVNEITIKGHLTKMENYFGIKKMIKGFIEDGANTITIKIPDSATIPSSIVGLFLRSISEDKVKIKLLIANEQLYKLLDSLKMIEVFDVQYM